MPKQINKQYATYIRHEFQLVTMGCVESVSVTIIPECIHYVDPPFEVQYIPNPEPRPLPGEELKIRNIEFYLTAEETRALIKMLELSLGDIRISPRSRAH